MGIQLDLAIRLAPFGSDSGATLSPCRRYRYRLWRSWGDRESRCVFVGVNPSTADESADDPTIRKCVGFAKRWGFGAIDMVNLFAWRSTDVRGLLTADDPVGPENDEIVEQALADARRVVLCWGKHPPRVRDLVSKRSSQGLWVGICTHPKAGTLGLNADRTPKHPLMLAYATPFEGLTASVRARP